MLPNHITTAFISSKWKKKKVKLKVNGALLFTRIVRWSGEKANSRVWEGCPDSRLGI